VEGSGGRFVRGFSILALSRHPEGLADGLAKIIEIKFGKAGQRLGKRAYQMKSSETLRKLMERLMRAQSLSEAEKLFDKAESQKAKALS